MRPISRWNQASISEQVQSIEKRLTDLINQEGDENWADIRNEMGHAMKQAAAYRPHDLMQTTMDKIAELKGASNV